MNKATLRRLEDKLLPRNDGIVRQLVGLHETPDGLACDTCGTVHADLAAAEAAHPGPGVLFLMIHVVKAQAEG